MAAAVTISGAGVASLAAAASSTCTGVLQAADPMQHGQGFGWSPQDPGRNCSSCALLEPEALCIPFQCLRAAKICPAYWDVILANRASAIKHLYPSIEDLIAQRRPCVL